MTIQVGLTIAGVLIRSGHVLVNRLGCERCLRRTWSNLFVTELHNAVKIFEGFLLRALCFAQLFHQVRLDILKLLYLVLHFADVVLSLLLIVVVVLGDFMLDLGFVQLLECDELLLMLSNENSD